MVTSTEKVSAAKSGSRSRHLNLTFAILVLVAAVVLAVAVRFEHHKPKRDEVSRATSPDGKVTAVLYELPGNAKTSFDYQVAVIGDGKTQEVAELSGAMRNDRAYGVNLHWLSDDHLSIDYFTTQSVRVMMSRVEAGGRVVRVSLRNGIRDNNALPGGMLFHLQQAP
ncbi:hypothetical protein HNQ77_003371 [Silvibacterium bohemicum]|uniref:Uncharacterized protein n=1 Tax=Silvibacterium bohemicum TaxID=1577686 RepID=A0A841JVK3_9BACT|nr:hypothetical protein [Silvibacterium bohemicum]MBB6145413.1 hypothetical protein [Silvibacterium bohemicum]